MLEEFLQSVLDYCIQTFDAKEVKAKQRALAYEKRYQVAPPKDWQDEEEFSLEKPNLALLRALWQTQHNSANTAAATANNHWLQECQNIISRYQSLEALIASIPQQQSRWLLQLSEKTEPSEILAHVAQFEDQLTALLFSNDHAKPGIMTSLEQAKQHSVITKDTAGATKRLTEITQEYTKAYLSNKIESVTGVIKHCCRTAKQTIAAIGEQVEANTTITTSVAQIKAALTTFTDAKQKEQQSTSEIHLALVKAQADEIEILTNKLNNQAADAAAQEAASGKVIATAREQAATAIQRATALDKTIATMTEQKTALTSEVAGLQEVVTCYRQEKAEFEAMAQIVAQLEADKAKQHRELSRMLRRAFCLDFRDKIDAFRLHKEAFLKRFPNVSESKDTTTPDEKMNSLLFDTSMAEASAAEKRSDYAQAIISYLNAYKFASQDQSKAGLFRSKRPATQSQTISEKLKKLFIPYFNSVDLKNSAQDCIDIIMKMPESIDPVFDLDLYPNILFNLFNKVLMKIEKNHDSHLIGTLREYYDWLVIQLAPLYIDQLDDYSNLKEVHDNLKNNSLLSDYFMRLQKAQTLLSSPTRLQNQQHESTDDFPIPKKPTVATAQPNPDSVSMAPANSLKPTATTVKTKQKKKTSAKGLRALPPPPVAVPVQQPQMAALLTKPASVTTSLSNGLPPPPPPPPPPAGPPITSSSTSDTSEMKTPPGTPRTKLASGAHESASPLKANNLFLKSIQEGKNSRLRVTNFVSPSKARKKTTASGLASILAQSMGMVDAAHNELQDHLSQRRTAMAPNDGPGSDDEWDFSDDEGQTLTKAVKM